MPVVILTAPSPSLVEESTVLSGIASAVADALGLEPDGVHAISVRANAATTGGSETMPWPVAMLHGREREAAAMRAAVVAVTGLLSESYGVHAEQTWVQWVR